MQVAHVATSYDITAGSPIAVDGPIREAACQAPWRVVERRPNGIARLRNEGVEAAKFVRVLVSGRAMVAVTPPQHVAPGEVAEFQVFGERREGELMLPDAHLVVQWYSVDDVAWLWSFAW